jgi:hypothetical protein
MQFDITVNKAMWVNVLKMWQLENKLVAAPSNKSEPKYQLISSVHNSLKGKFMVACEEELMQRWTTKVES